MPSYNPVFSQGFIYYSAATPNTSFDVPDGYTAVVRQCSMTTIAGAATCYFNIQDSPTAPTICIAIIYLAGLLENGSEEGRWVVPGGGVISISDQNIGTDDNVYVGGYLLRNTLT